MKNSDRLFYGLVVAIIGLLSVAVLAITYDLKRINTMREHASASVAPLGRSDSLLVAYAISLTAEASFDPASKAESPFWAEWKFRSLFCAHLRPFIEISPVGYFSGENDARMQVCAVYGAAGLYLLFDVDDDNFPGFTQTRWASDAVDVLLDSDSSQGIYRQGPGSRLTTAWNLTRHSIQIQYSFADGRGEDSISVNHPNPDTTLVRDGAAPTDLLLFRSYTTAQVRDTFGIVVKRIIVDAHRRMQEWFIPWRCAGAGGFQGSPAQGRRIALCVQYNDADVSKVPFVKSGELKIMSWGGRGNAFGSPIAWGDLEFGPSLPSSDITQNVAP